MGTSLPRSPAEKMLLSFMCIPLISVWDWSARGNYPETGFEEIGGNLLEEDLGTTSANEIRSLLLFRRSGFGSRPSRGDK